MVEFTSFSSDGIIIATVMMFVHMYVGVSFVASRLPYHSIYLENILSLSNCLKAVCTLLFNNKV